MSLKQPYSANEIDALVRAHLEVEGRQVDARALLAAVCERLAEGSSAGPTLADRPLRFESKSPLGWSRLGRPGSWGLGIAASVMLAVGVAWYVIAASAPPNAYALVTAARSALARRADRCYRVESDVPKSWRRSNSLLRVDGETLLWTRGDRFRLVVDEGAEEFIWGQDEKGRVWLIRDSERGLVFEQNEVPPMLAAARSFLRVDSGRLMNQLLKNFDLQIESLGGERPKANVAVIRATAKPGNEKGKMLCNAARLEININNKVIQKMELSNTAKGVIQGTFTFTLVETGTQPDATYQIDGNLPSGANVFGREQADTRGKLLRELAESRRGD
jgi:hypothetical protein